MAEEQVSTDTLAANSDAEPDEKRRKFDPGDSGRCSKAVYKEKIQ